MFSFVGNIFGQGVVYVTPSTPLTYIAGGGLDEGSDIDITGDGTIDFTLTSWSNGSATLAANGNNQLLSYQGLLAALSCGASVDSTGSGNTWSTGQLTLSVVMGLDGPPGFSEGGNFVGLTNAYVGFDKVVNGQNYYGWIQVQDALGLDLGVYGTVTAWAYETTPNTPILAGQVSEPISFTADITGSNEAPPNRSVNSGTGTFTLVQFINGYILDYNIVVDGSFQPLGAGLFGPPSRGERPPYQIADLGNPQVVPIPLPSPNEPVPLGQITTSFNSPADVSLSLSNFVYQGQITLSSNQVTQLLQRRFYVNLKSKRYRQGELRGEIWPDAPVHFSATLAGYARLPHNQKPQHGEAMFTLAGTTLSYQVAVDTNFVGGIIGIFDSGGRLLGTQNQIALLNTTFGVQIGGGVPDSFGLPGQVLYEGELTLTDDEVNELENGQLFVEALAHRCNVIMSGQITE